MPKIIAKANDDAINWCECEGAIAGYPGQLDCPWCGCGWLFSCHRCRKAFTFGVVTEADQDLSALAREDQKNRGMTVNVKVTTDWVDYMVKQLKPFAPGTEVVYLDGRVIAADKAPVRFKGWYAQHSMKTLPHARRDGKAIDAMLGDVDYWRSRELPNRD